MNRVLIVSSEFPPGPGGIGTHACQLATHLRNMDWDVHVLTVQDYAEEKDIHAFNANRSFTVTWLKHTSNPVSEAWYRLQNLRRVIRDWQPDVMIASGERQIWIVAVFQLIARFLAGRYRRPWCAIWHGIILHNRLAARLSRWAYGQADLVISVSLYSLQQILKLGVKPKREVVITNGADHHTYNIDQAAGRLLRRNAGLTDAKVMLTVGHVSERKGQDIVIRALPELLQTLPNVHYVMAGLPSLQTSYQRLAERLGVDSHVHFWGKVDGDVLKALYNACDLFVLTSRHSSNGEYEGYGIVAVEAALCGKPSVVAGNSGLAEAVEDGQTGLVVPEDDPTATASALKKLFQDEKLRNSMGERARQSALETKTWQTCASIYDKTLRQLMKAML